MKPLILCGLLALLLSGCGAPASETGSASDINKDPPAPAGLTYVKDIPGGLTVGTQIYNMNGALVGTVQKIEPNHTFSNGKTTTGICFLQPRATGVTWMNESAVDRAFFVKSK